MSFKRKMRKARGEPPVNPPPRERFTKYPRSESLRCGATMMELSGPLQCYLPRGHVGKCEFA